MVKKCKSDVNLTAKQQGCMKKAEKRREREYMMDNVAKMNSLVKSLECSLYESQKNEQNLKRQQEKASKRDEAKKENKQLLNVLQQQCNHECRSQVDVSPSYSTVSMVHLQYKYEELLSSHEGLLKLLETKVKEVRKCYAENERLHTELKSTRFRTEEQQGTVNMICDKYITMKERKERKIRKLRFERDTIKLAHDKLVHLLHTKCMEQDEILFHQLGRTPDCLKSLLINEIRRANKLQYENVILNQKNVYLKAKIHGDNININLNE